MKKISTIGSIAAVYALSAGSLFAQAPDSVTVRETTRETTTVTSGPVQPAPAAAPAQTTPVTVVQEKHEDERPPLRHMEIGFRYMPTFSSLALRTTDNETVQGDVSMSHGWGAFIGINFTRHVGIVGEVNYIQINQKYKDRNLNRKVQISYLNIPVMLSLNTNKEAPVNLNFVVGPQFGLNVGSKITGDTNGNSDTLRAVVAARPGDVGLAYGAGLEFALNDAHTVRLDLGFRGYYGLVDMRATQSNSNPDTYNVLLKASRKTYAGYIGLAFMF